jgi:hypothetical protein
MLTVMVNEKMERKDCNPVQHPSRLAHGEHVAMWLCCTGGSTLFQQLASMSVTGEARVASILAAKQQYTAEAGSRKRPRGDDVFNKKNLLTPKQLRALAMKGLKLTDVSVCFGPFVTWCWLCKAVVVWL